MHVEIIRGKMDLTKLVAIDAVICPTSPACSGSHGLSHAIHEAAGPELKKELKTAMNGKLLESGHVLCTGGHGLGVKKIAHASVPVNSGKESSKELLKNCYIEALTQMTFPTGENGCKRAATTLLGTGSCGWSHAESMDALWQAVLQINARHGSVYFGKGSLETLCVYYPDEAFDLMLSYSRRLSQVFFDAPDHWGTRGDPYLWYDLMVHFDNPRYNKIRLKDFIGEIQRYFHEKTGKWLCGDTEQWVEEYAHGGMSSGFVSGYMAELGIPLLCDNFIRRGFADHLQSFILVPVEVLSRNTGRYNMKLPYDLLPLLSRMRGNHDEVVERKRVLLGGQGLCYLTTVHYQEMPQLVDYYSIDVEEANDSHYKLGVPAAQALCKELGCADMMLPHALTDYLRCHGVPGLKLLAGRFANEQMHF